MADFPDIPEFSQYEIDGGDYVLELIQPPAKGVLKRARRSTVVGGPQPAGAPDAPQAAPPVADPRGVFEEVSVEDRLRDVQARYTHRLASVASTLNAAMDELERVPGREGCPHMRELTELLFIARNELVSMQRGVDFTRRPTTATRHKALPPAPEDKRSAFERIERTTVAQDDYWLVMEQALGALDD